ncbi:sugar phosphate isomerase/epimerase [uncultured Brevibacillus sp.]|uniref:sugar phosphate isomerase/epimerase family protein n=1 Tax=uncultured Brevibacillus sp. TaxID=169970 RepID=UPI002598D16C|nr:TIM barrel protein [uncultured Brevibacillus sp.]
MIELAPYAKEKKAVIGVENIWNQFLLSPLKMRDFIDKIGSPWVRVFFDVGNVVAFGYPEQWIRILGKRIVKVHFKDYRRDSKGLAGFVDLLAFANNGKADPRLPIFWPRTECCLSLGKAEMPARAFDRECSCHTLTRAEELVNILC